MMNKKPKLGVAAENFTLPDGTRVQVIDASLVPGSIPDEVQSKIDLLRATGVIPTRGAPDADSGGDFDPV